MVKIKKNFSKDKFDGSKKYSAEGLFTILTAYNLAVGNLDGEPASIETVDKLLKEHYGDKAPYIGEVLTDQYDWCFMNFDYEIFYE